MKKIALILCLGIVIMAIFYSRSPKVTRVKNSFNRKFTDKNISLENKKILNKGFYQIIDITENFITICKYREPYDQLKFSIDLKNQQLYKLPIEKEKFEGLTNVTFLGDSMFILNGLTSTVYQIDSNHKDIKKSLLDTEPFYQSEVINPNSFIIRSKVEIDGENRRKLKKVNIKGDVLASYLPEKQVDGYFCSDGMFAYDKDTKRLVYMYFYRGVFSCLDSNLKEMYKAKTIDTVYHASIKLKTIANQITHVTPPFIINKRLCIANDKIYIHSALKADNEKNRIFNVSDAIDVYDLQTGTYNYSFYIPKLDNQKLTEFKVYKNNIIALYYNTLAIFKMSDLK